MPLQPKREIAKLKSGVHGGIDFAELEASGIDAKSIIDFSVSTNPYMPPPGTKEALAATPVECYPDSQSTALRWRLAEKLGVDAANILVGSGTTELIRLIALVYFRRVDRIVIPEPTYGEYEIACRLVGVRPTKYRTKENEGFSPRIEEVVDLIRQKQSRGIFICNPNNPTGLYLSSKDIEKVMEAMKDGLLILDEAYLPFVAESWNSLNLIKNGNTIILRSMTKDYGLPGLRLGYAVACREIIDSLRIALPPWNVNAVAQSVGLAVLEKEEYLKDSLKKTREARDFLVSEIKRLGFKLLSSDAHFFLVKVGNATACRRALLTKGILVRDCSSFGLKQYIRIAPRPLPECRKLIAAFSDILKTGGDAVS
ncbi:MAG: histidinol-phosphate transaminase [Dehalococcoidales bacterium]